MCLRCPSWLSLRLHHHQFVDTHTHIPNSDLRNCACFCVSYDRISLNYVSVRVRPCQTIKFEFSATVNHAMLAHAEHMCSRTSWVQRYQWNLAHTHTMNEWRRAYAPFHVWTHLNCYREEWLQHTRTLIRIHHKRELYVEFGGCKKLVFLSTSLGIDFCWMCRTPKPTDNNNSRALPIPQPF